MLIESSKLRQRITVERRQDSRNSVGEPITQWVSVCTVWAEVVDRTSKQVYDTEQQLDAVSTRIRIRHRDDIAPQMRVIHKGQIYEIHGVLDINGLGDFIELTCQRGMNDG